MCSKTELLTLDICLWALVQKTIKTSCNRLRWEHLRCTNPVLHLSSFSLPVFPAMLEEESSSSVNSSSIHFLTNCSLDFTLRLIGFSLVAFSFGRLGMIGEILVEEQGRLTGVTGTEVDCALLGMEDAGWWEWDVTSAMEVGVVVVMATLGGRGGSDRLVAEDWAVWLYEFSAAWAWSDNGTTHIPDSMASSLVSMMFITVLSKSIFPCKLSTQSLVVNTIIDWPMLAFQH